jgi:hypothetical protein
MDEPAVDRMPVRQSRRLSAVVVAVAVVVAMTAVGAYAAASAHTVTKTKTVFVATTTPTTLPPRCAPGAAPGSCNIDEAREALIPDRPLDAATRATVATELVAARAAALKYPTVADAVAAGFIPAGKFSPETGAHYINIGATFGSFDASNPGSYIYDGNSPTSRIIGLMYLGGAINSPDGFAGPNDHWHRHSNTCVIFGQGAKIIVPFAADSSVSAGQCAAVHGTFMRRTTWMVHAWVVPGWESPLGVFSHNNPDVKCANGTVKTDAVGFCQGT